MIAVYIMELRVERFALEASTDKNVCFFGCKERQGACMACLHSNKEEQSGTKWRLAGLLHCS
jgi:hypothetical protein